MTQADPNAHKQYQAMKTCDPAKDYLFNVEKKLVQVLTPAKEKQISACAIDGTTAATGRSYMQMIADAHSRCIFSLLRAGLILLGPPMEQQRQVGSHCKVFEIVKSVSMSIRNLLQPYALNTIE